MKGDSILLFLILFPMAGAVLSYLIGRKNKKISQVYLQKAPFRDIVKDRKVEFLPAVLFLLKRNGE